MARFPAALAERAASLLVLLVVWEATARLAHSRLFPSPASVLTALADEALHGELLHDLGATLTRVAVAFTLAMSVGTAVGIAMARFRAIDTLLDSGVVLLLNLPALVVAVLLYIWLGLTEAAAMGAVTLARALSDTFAGIAPIDAPFFIIAQCAGAVAALAMTGWFVSERTRS